MPLHEKTTDQHHRLFRWPGRPREGFSSFTDSDGERPFQIRMSAEKESSARTLTPEPCSASSKQGDTTAYFDYVEGRISKESLIEQHPAEWAEAVRETMGGRQRLETITSVFISVSMHSKKNIKRAVDSNWRAAMSGLLRWSRTQHGHQRIRYKRRSQTFPVQRIPSGSFHYRTGCICYGKRENFSSKVDGELISKDPERP